MHETNRIRSRHSKHSPSGRVRPALPIVALAFLLLTACSGEAPLPGDPLRLVQTPLPDPVLAESYQQDLTPTGGLRPYTFQLQEGELPPGMSLQGGTLIGTPTETGRYEFTVSVSDANLSSTYATYTVTVRDLPVPTLDLAVPDTEVRGDTQVRARVIDARRLRGVRVWIDWEDPAVRLAPGGVRTSRDDVILFQSEREGGVSVDVAVLGDALDGDHELFRLELTTDEAVVLGMDVRTEFLYGDRHAFEEARVGAPRADATEDATEPVDEGDPETVPDEPEGSGDTPGDPASDDASADEPAADPAGEESP